MTLIKNVEWAIKLKVNVKKNLFTTLCVSGFSNIFLGYYLKCQNVNFSAWCYLVFLCIYLVLLCNVIDWRGRMDFSLFKKKCFLFWSCAKNKNIDRNIYNHLTCILWIIIINWNFEDFWLFFWNFKTMYRNLTKICLKFEFKWVIRLIKLICVTRVC